MIVYLHKNIIFKKLICYFFIFIFLNLVSSCNTYNVVTKEGLKENDLNNVIKEGKYLIVHEPDTAWHLAKPHFGQNNLLGDKTVLAEWHKSYKMPPMEKDNKYDRKDTLESQVINEIHLYTKNILYLDSVRVMIPIDSIAYIQLYKGKNKTVLPIFLGATGLLLIILIITSISFSGMDMHI